MKKLGIIFILLLSFTVSKAAQTPEQRATDISENMKIQLGLTDDQKTKVYDMTINKIKELNKLQKQNEQGAFQVAKRSYPAEICTLLNDDQKLKYNALRREFVTAQKAGKLVANPVIDAPLEFMVGL